MIVVIVMDNKLYVSSVDEGMECCIFNFIFLLGGFGLVDVVECGWEVFICSLVEKLYCYLVVFDGCC